MKRRVLIGAALAGAAFSPRRSAIAASVPPKTRNAVFVHGLFADGSCWSEVIQEAFLRDFAGDLPVKQARVLYAAQQPFRRSLTGEKTSNAAWRSKPSFYAVSTKDRTIDPDLQRFMAKRMDAKTIELNSSQVSLISHPDAVAGLIWQALAV
jgi:pimeloyl-ACP methyl ester carboxylesterase